MNIMFFLTTKRNVTFLYDDEDVVTGLRKLKNSGFHAIPVISRSGVYRGTITEGDFLWLMIGLDEVVGGEKTREMRIGDIPLNSSNPAVSCECSIRGVLDHAAQHNFVPVVDSRDVFIGIVTRSRIIEHYMRSLNT